MLKNLVKKVQASPLYVRHGKKIKFLMTGGLNTLLDFLIYGLLANMLGVYVLTANVVSTSICMAVSFWLNYTFVWRSKKSKKETAPKFIAVSLFSAWVVQSVVIFLVVGLLGEDANLIAKLVGVSFGMVSNYLGYKFVFSTH